MLVVKLGGSLITNKETFSNAKGKKIFYRNRTARLINEICSSSEEFILVHGAGSFGHPLAKKHDLKEGYKHIRQIPVVSRVQQDVRMLNFNIIQTMREGGIYAVPIAPNALVTLNKGKLKRIDMEAFRYHLSMSVVPVTFGDIVPDTARKFGICSGDDMMLYLAREFKPRLAIFVTRVDGIYTKDPKESSSPPPRFIEEINEKTIKLIKNSKPGVADVTGGMKRKARIMMKIAHEGVDCIVLNGLVPNRLKKAIIGENIRCTIVRKIK